MNEKESIKEKCMEMAVYVCEGLPFDFTIFQAALGECSLAEADCVFHQKVQSNGGKPEDSHALCKKKTLTHLPLGLTVT